jgi:hypothetical protein
MAGMSDSFLAIAETRADHLRRLSRHERELEWVNASLSEVETEIPELELAMAVFRRLNPKAGELNDNGQPGFLAITEVRVGHLRELSRHMRALDWVSAPLAEIEAEIPDLEKAMSVYRRLAPDDGAEVVAAVAPSEPSGSKARSARSRDSEAANQPPSFKEYALQHLDSV